MLKICPKCDSVASYNSYFKGYMCPKCKEVFGEEVEYTVRYYNKHIFPAYNSAYCFVRNLDHTISKCDNPYDVRKQLECAGLDTQTKEFILSAIEYYKQSFLNEIK